MNIITKNTLRFTYALRGIWYAAIHDWGFSVDLFGGGLFVALVIYFCWPLSTVELLFLVLAWILILVTEIQNTALETVLDKIHPGQDESIGRSKDMASAAVVIAGVFALAVVLTIVLT